MNLSFPTLNGSYFNASEASNLIHTYNQGGAVLDTEIIQGVCSNMFGFEKYMLIAWFGLKLLHAITGFIIDHVNNVESKLFKVCYFLNQRTLLSAPKTIAFAILFITGVRVFGFTPLKYGAIIFGVVSGGLWLVTKFIDAYNKEKKKNEETENKQD